MALPHWRKFVFFDEEPITGTELNQLLAVEEQNDVSRGDQPLVNVKISCSSSGRGLALLGDTNGYVHIVNNQMVVNSFRANQIFTSHVKQVAKSPIFITCGSDQSGVNPLIKLWDPNKLDRSNQPTCIRLIRANIGFIRPADITCIECNDALTLIIVGYDDGTIVICHGDVTRPPKSKIGKPMKVSDKPVTGIVIRNDVNFESSGSSTNLNTPQVETTAFVATKDEIFWISFSEKTFSKTQIDKLGCRPKCCCLLPTNGGLTDLDNLFAVGRDDAVYFYQKDERGPCLAFEGEKFILHKFKSYLVIVGQESQDEPLDGNSSSSNLPERRMSLNIYDLKNKYVAYSSVVPEVQELFTEWNHLFIVSKNGQVIRFGEKGRQSKLQTILRANQPDLVMDVIEQLVEGQTGSTIKMAHSLLLELHLNAWRKEKDDLMKNLHADKIKNLLSQPREKFDFDRALILCRNNRFDDGLVDLYARAGLYHLVLQYYIDQDDSLRIMKTCEQFGSQHPNLYLPALTHYSKNGDERLSQILRAIEHNNVLPPMVVIKILLESRRASLGSVKGYLVRFLGKLQDGILDNENAIDHYKDDTEDVRQRIEEFENYLTVFKPSKCFGCQNVLDLPSVHFLCSHSFHQNCFLNYSAENDECPICMTTNKKLLEEIGSHEMSKSNMVKLEREFTMQSDDPFNSLAKLFGYGLFN